jgi:UDP-N-acetylglucosamine 2-epimerase (non-hydrolysing)
MILRYDLKRGASKMRVGVTAIQTVKLLLRRRFEFWRVRRSWRGYSGLARESPTLAEHKEIRSMSKRRVAVVVGTRPEAIKMAPLYLTLKADSRVDVRLIAAAQHRQLLDQVLSAFRIQPALDLDLMRPGQTLADLTSRAITALQQAYSDLRPDEVLVHGDTTSCFAGAIAAFYEKIPLGHVEAGLRTYDFQAPWPEEMNRRLVDPISRWCFAPTETAAENLRAERIPEGNIFVTGNTVVDAVVMAREMVQRNAPEIPDLPQAAFECKRLILITGHRRESFGLPFEEFCMALKDIAREFEDVALVYPVHLNPNVWTPVHRILGKEDRIFLIPPVEYLPFVYLMERCHFIITDSGGIQEEAPSFGKPVLVTRTATERPEAIERQCAMLVGTSRQNILREASRLLTDPEAYTEMTRAENPYGDGRASQRIADILLTSELT